MYWHLRVGMKKRSEAEENMEKPHFYEDGNPKLKCCSNIYDIYLKLAINYII